MAKKILQLIRDPNKSKQIQKDEFVLSLMSMESYSFTIPTRLGLSFGVKCIHVSFIIFYSALIFKPIAVPPHHQNHLVNNKKKSRTYSTLQNNRNL